MDKIIGLATIIRVYEEQIDGRPQLLLESKTDEGKIFSAILDRETARELIRAYGPHPLVNKFFALGKGLQ